MIRYVDHHVYTLIQSAKAMAVLMCNLPETDHVLETKTLLELHNEILLCLLEEKHFGTDNLNKVITHSETIINENQRTKKDEKES